MVHARYIVGFLAQLFWALPTDAQNANLVPNHNFDFVVNCPFATGTLRNAAPWFPPNRRSTDLAHRCGSPLVQIPENTWGYQEPVSGNGYAGIRTFVESPPPTSKDYREYLAVRLKQPLEAGALYFLRFYVSCGEIARYVSSDLGMAFAPDSIVGAGVLSFEPAIKNAAGRWLEDTNSWISISGTYQAKGDEAFLIIGNFLDDLSTRVRLRRDGKGTESSTYYFIDEVEVIKCADPLPDPLIMASDSVLCRSDSLLLIAPERMNAEYTWKGGSNAPFAWVYQPGWYHLDLEIEQCSFRDSIFIPDALPENLVPASRTVNLCPGDTLSVGVKDTAFLWKWDDGWPLANRRVQTPGRLVLYSERGNCRLRDTLDILPAYTPGIDLPVDSVFCRGDSLRLTAVAKSIRWSTGSQDTSIWIATPGAYSVDLSGPCADTTIFFEIQGRECPCQLSLPNVFSPNGDGFNDAFIPFPEGDLTDLHWEIFDRWGQRCFHTSRADNSWDGRANGSDLPEGVYYVVAEYRCPSQGGIKKVQQGVLLLLK